jgi:hypothetical protein
MVPSDNPRDPAPLPLLEKFANLLDLERRLWNIQAQAANAESAWAPGGATPTRSVGMTDSELDRKIEQKLVAYLGPGP